MKVDAVALVDEGEIEGFTDLAVRMNEIKLEYDFPPAGRCTWGWSVGERGSW